MWCGFEGTLRPNTLMCINSLICVITLFSSYCFLNYYQLLLLGVDLRALTGQTHDYQSTLVSNWILLLGVYSRALSAKHTTTGWRSLLGCLKSHVIFRKRATNYRALLWKITYEDKASYDSTPPCISQLLCANRILL